MFTGIIEKVEEVKDMREEGGSAFVSIARPADWELKLGDSIAINGVCSTVKEFDNEKFTVEYMPETLRKTTFGNVVQGALGPFVNLERSLKVGDRLDGHMVQGHVDTVGEVLDAEQDGDARIVKITVPAEYMKYIAEKGSVTVDGVSLTVVSVSEGWFSVSLVSYTLEHTAFGKLEKGSKVNIETDVLARYTEKLLHS